MLAAISTSSRQDATKGAHLRVFRGQCRPVRVIGIDLAWREGTADRVANETGLIAADESGQVIDAGWTCGTAEAIGWIDRAASPDTLLMVDAPLVVSNANGQRLCEREVGQRYGRWKVSANSTNLASAPPGWSRPAGGAC